MKNIETFKSQTYHKMLKIHGAANVINKEVLKWIIKIENITVSYI